MRSLEDVKILDFTHVLAGPFGTRVLADMGADVVKIMSAVRETGRTQQDSPYYLMWNRNKRSLALDMRHEGSRQLARRLADEADVVTDNFSPGVLDRWNVGYDIVSETNPGVIYVQMSGMGATGPWSDFVTYAPTIHGLGGLTHLTGVPGRGDIGIGYSYNDHQAGLHGAVAVLAALEGRRSTGRGQRVDLSQFEVGVNFAGLALLDWFGNGRSASPVVNRDPYDKNAPHGCYPCAGAASDALADERWVAIACMCDEQWRRFRDVLGDPEWARDPALATVQGRSEAVDMLDKRIAEWTQGLTAEVVMERCQAAGVPAGVVQTGLDLCERDPQLELSGFLAEIEKAHPIMGKTYADRLPIYFERTPCDEYRPAPVVGQHNAEVLDEWLGMSEEEVRRGEEAGHLR